MQPLNEPAPTHLPPLLPVAAAHDGPGKFPAWCWANTPSTACTATLAHRMLALRHSLLDDQWHGWRAPPSRNRPRHGLPWAKANLTPCRFAPVGNGLVLRRQAYRTSLGVVGGGLFWLVGAQCHDRLDADCHLAPHAAACIPAALVAETNFRRAMEKFMLTGMRAMDLKGRITYVNAAFCQMTGWSKPSWWAARPRFLLARPATANHASA